MSYFYFRGSPASS